VHVKPHPIFGRTGDNLTVSVPVTFSEAALGAEIKVPSLRGVPVSVRIPAGTPSGRTFRVRGKGVPGLQSSGKGDMYVQVRIQTPSRLSKRQRELLAELSGTFEIENKPEPRSLLEKVKDIFG